jgi:hypothetical protein
MRVLRTLHLELRRLQSLLSPAHLFSQAVKLPNGAASALGRSSSLANRCTDCCTASEKPVPSLSVESARVPPPPPASPRVLRSNENRRPPSHTPSHSMPSLQVLGGHSIHYVQGSCCRSSYQRSPAYSEEDNSSACDAAACTGAEKGASRLLVSAARCHLPDRVQPLQSTHTLAEVGFLCCLRRHRDHSSARGTQPAFGGGHIGRTFELLVFFDEVRVSQLKLLCPSKQ